MVRGDKAMKKTTAHIGLGSNLGERATTLMKAVQMLDDLPGIDVHRISQFIETNPVGPSEQGKYLNAAAEIETTLSPQKLLSVMHEVEEALGRDRSAEKRWGPRTCDLDMLLFGTVIINTPEVTVPHPRLHQRLFVLHAMVEIAADVVHPVLGKTMQELLEELEAPE